MELPSQKDINLPLNISLLFFAHRKWPYKTVKPAVQNNLELFVQQTLQVLFYLQNAKLLI